MAPAKVTARIAQVAVVMKVHPNHQKSTWPNPRSSSRARGPPSATAYESDIWGFARPKISVTPPATNYIERSKVGDRTRVDPVAAPTLGLVSTYNRAIYSSYA